MLEKNNTINFKFFFNLLLIEIKISFIIDIYQFFSYQGGINFLIPLSKIIENYSIFI